MYMYNVLNVSNYIINYGNEKGYNITLGKLNKLLYFTQAAFIAVYGEPAFGEKMYEDFYDVRINEIVERYKSFKGEVLVDNGRYLMADDDKILIGMIVDGLGKFKEEELFAAIEKKSLRIIGAEISVDILRERLEC